MSIIDLNRYQKTYPFLRLKPQYEQQGTAPSGPTINNNSLFTTDNIDVIYRDILVIVDIPDPFILVTQNNVTDIVMPINYANSIRDTFFDVDNLTGDITLDF